MSEHTGAVPVRSLNVVEASVNELSAALIGRLVTSAVTDRGCGTFVVCGTYGRRFFEEAETETAA